MGCEASRLLNGNFKNSLDFLSAQRDEIPLMIKLQQKSSSNISNLEEELVNSSAQH